MTNDSGHPWHCFGKEIRDKYGGLRIGLVILIDQPECDFLPPMRTSRRLASVIASLRGIASAAGVGFFDRTGKPIRTSCSCAHAAGSSGNNVNQANKVATVRAVKNRMGRVVVAQTHFGFPLNIRAQREGRVDGAYAQSLFAPVRDCRSVCFYGLSVSND